MAPLPKRRHSTRRSGKREAAKLRKKLPALSICKHCGSPKLPHLICPKCGYYK